MFSVCFYDFFNNASSPDPDDFTYYAGLTPVTPDPDLPDDLYTVDLDYMAASERGCCVPRCGKIRKDDIVLHSFPNPDKDMDRYLEWTRAVGLSISSLEPHYVYRNRRVCHAHFETKHLTWTRRLSPNAVPTLFLPGEPSAQVSEEPKLIAKSPKLPEKMPMFDQKALIKAVNKMQIKKDKYATRLKKADDKLCMLLFDEMYII